LSGRAEDWATSLRTGAWLGLVAGFAEFLLRRARAAAIGVPPPLGAHLVWMPAAGLAVVLGLGSLGLALLARTRPGLITPPRAAGALGFVGLVDLLLLWSPPLAGYAVLLLAAGLATQVARLVAARPAGFSRLVNRTMPWLLVAVAVLPAGITGWRAFQEHGALARLPVAGRGRPNVLLLVLDTVRAMNLSVYGYGRRTTPTMESIGAAGVRFDRAIATAPWTLPSHAGMFTGRWHHELSADWDTPLDRRMPTLAEALAGLGYRSGGFVGNTVYCGRDFGLDRGFAHYEDVLVTPGQVLRASNVGMELAELRPVQRLLGNGHRHYQRKTAAEITDAFLQWAEADTTRPFFAFLNFFDAHSPYYAPAAYDSLFTAPGPAPVRPSRRAMVDYDRGIAYIDAEIGRLLAALEREGRLANTLVIIVSDHGEEFDEHGMEDHGNSLYLPALHVPLLLALPGRLPAGTTVPQTVSLRDLPATVLDLVGASPAAPFPGTSLARFWHQPGTPADTILAEVRYARNLPEWYPVSKGDLRSVLADDRHFIAQADSTTELYDITRDPWELVNRVTEDSEALHRAALAGFLARQPLGSFSSPRRQGTP
jgi:arylsulfatase A-like enzyme